MEHAPGPRGSPQVPHPPEGMLPEAELLAETAKTESCGDRLLLWHLGQEGFSLPKIRASNRCSHSLQEYSKIGMVSSRARNINQYTTDLDAYTVPTRFHQLWWSATVYSTYFELPNSSYKRLTPARRFLFARGLYLFSSTKAMWGSTLSQLHSRAGNAPTCVIQCCAVRLRCH